MCTHTAVQLPRGLDAVATKKTYPSSSKHASVIALSVFVPSSAGVYQKFPWVKNEKHRHTMREDLFHLEFRCWFMYISDPLVPAIANAFRIVQSEICINSWLVTVEARSCTAYQQEGSKSSDWLDCAPYLPEQRDLFVIWTLSSDPTDIAQLANVATVWTKL